MSIQERFDSKWIPEPNSGCYIWTGCLNAAGYGRFNYQGKITNAHRISWELHNNKNAEGFVIRHKCDNRTCVNPDHLIEGTQADNIKDIYERKRNRHLSGEEHPRSKLTEELVDRIRNDGRISRVIAESYGISRSQVSKIKSGKAWR